MSVQGTLSAAERSIRSVFVGNIPYEATEEQLKDIFSEVGPVISFRLVYDRETGKPKGYGFCEYKDQDTALSAMRNLNGYELNGRALRVDNAASEKNKEELKNLQAALGGPPQEVSIQSPYGGEVDSDKAPEAISKAVASLPPEQMFELMKQMKLCIQNNPNEARKMLLQNPQLAYALLQAQVVMRIVDPQVAMSMLHRANSAQALQNLTDSANSSNAITNNVASVTGSVNFVDNNFGSGISRHSPAPQLPLPSSLLRPSRPALLGDHPADPVRGSNNSGLGTQFNEPHGRDFDMRDPRGMDPRNLGDRDMRVMGPGGGGRDPRDTPRDPRELRDSRDPRADSDIRGNYDSRFRDNDRGMFEGRSGYDQRGTVPFDTSLFEPRDPRLQPSTQGAAISVPNLRPQMAGLGRSLNLANMSPMGNVNRNASPSQISAQDQEKAALIMQVLQLSDQQISMLPPEQRQSIMVLKDQIARSAQP
uniref:RRM domain-containing protein n=1 Tax=Strigamia maritima TaxID=126957 RepID=T1JH34_STRMM